MRTRVVCAGLRGLRVAWLALTLSLMLVTTGCGDDDGSAGSDAGLDARPDVEVDASTVPPTPSDDWCDRIASGPPADTTFQVGLSALHAGARFFSTESADGTSCPYMLVGEALAAALDRTDPWTPAALTDFADRLESVCALETTDATLQPAVVEMVGDVALITPGTGPVVLPSGTAAVAVDLRGLPSVPGLWQALAAAVAPALATPVPRLERSFRRHDGMVDEYFSSNNVYSVSVLRRTPADLAATGDADLPLALLTGPVLAPAAAELALTLRAPNRAWIWGEDVLSRVAEARWYGVDAGHGGMVHVRSLYREPIRLMDVVPADTRHVDPTALLPQLSSMGDPDGLVLTPDLRPELQRPEFIFGYAHPEATTHGAVRAAVLSVHGALRLFFPYFHVVGDHIDQRLAEVLGEVDAAITVTRRDVWLRLWRFGEAVRDSHVYAFDRVPEPNAGCLPILPELIDGEIVVGRSNTAQLVAGDTITSIDGESGADFMARLWPVFGAAADGFRARNVLHFNLVQMLGSRTLGVRDPDGVTRTVTVDPGDCADVPPLREPRPAGYLNDLGAPSLYYLNMDGAVLDTSAALLQALTDAAGASGLVLDMRGYPGVDHHDVVARLVDSNVASMWFRVPMYDGPDYHWVDESNFYVSPAGPPNYLGPVVLLIGPRSVSAAENFAVILMDDGRFEAVVGRQSGASNGNITGLQLPGGYAFTFTGMEVQHTDHSTFHGIGVVPDVEVVPSATELRDGVDPELEEAVNILLNL